MADMLSALSYAHDLGIVHRDLKLENIMLEIKAGVDPRQPKVIIPKLIDFGLSIVLTTCEVSMDMCGTLTYCSP